MDLPKHVGTVAVGRTENIVESCLPSAPLPTRERNKDPCHIPIMHTHTPSRLTRSLKKQKRDQEPQDARHRRAAHTAWAISLRAAEVLSARGGRKKRARTGKPSSVVVTFAIVACEREPIPHPVTAHTKKKPPPLSTPSCERVRTPGGKAGRFSLSRRAFPFLMPRFPGTAAPSYTA